MANTETKMSIKEFKERLDALKGNIKEKGYLPEYARATSKLIGEFCSAKINQNQYELVNELIEFLTEQE